MRNVGHWFLGVMAINTRASINSLPSSVVSTTKPERSQVPLGLPLGWPNWRGFQGLAVVMVTRLESFEPGIEVLGALNLGYDAPNSVNFVTPFSTPNKVLPEGNKIWVLGYGVETHPAENLYHAALDSRLSQSLTFRTTIAEFRSHVIVDFSTHLGHYQ